MIPKKNKKIVWEKNTGGWEWKGCAACAQWLRSADRVLAYHPDKSRKLLAEAEHWEHMASAALLEHFKECTASSNDLMQPQQTANSNDARRLNS